MDDRIVRLESTVEQLRQAVESLQLRIDGLERDRPAAAVASAGDVVGDSSARTLLGLRSPGATAGKAHDPIVALSLIGRLFLVLAGGFFLRALTEAGALPATAGISLAFLYALLWLALADRASRLEQPTSALFHAIGAAIVAFPLLVEATTRFAVLGVAGSVLGLALLTFAFLFVAVRRRAYAVAWITVVAALPTCVVLLVKTGVPAPYALYLILFGVGTVWLAHAHGWSALVLGQCRDEVPAAPAAHGTGAEDGKVVGLRRPRRPDDLARCGVDQRGNRGTRRLDPRMRLAARPVADGGRIGRQRRVVQAAGHDLGHRRIERGAGRMIEVDGRHVSRGPRRACPRRHRSPAPAH